MLYINLFILIKICSKGTFFLVIAYYGNFELTAFKDFGFFKHTFMNKEQQCFVLFDFSRIRLIFNKRQYIAVIFYLSLLHVNYLLCLFYWFSFFSVQKNRN